MKAKSFADMQCSIARTLEQVGSWWSLLIIRDALMGARRFRQFERSLGIAKNTLASRLAQLIDSGILRKVPPADGSSYREYELTEKGRDIAPVLMTLAQWGDKWAAHENGPPFAFVDGATQDEISRIRPRRSDGTAIPFEEISLKPLDEGNAP